MVSSKIYPSVDLICFCESNFLLLFSFYNNSLVWCFSCKLIVRFRYFFAFKEIHIFQNNVLRRGIDFCIQ